MTARQRLRADLARYFVGGGTWAVAFLPFVIGIVELTALFYVLRHAARQERGWIRDLLAPEGYGEIIGGSQREERLDVLDKRMAQFGLDPAHYQWYRDFRRYGTVPHAGFGLGFERLVVYVCGLSNIRDAIAYPRAPGSAEF